LHDDAAGVLPTVTAPRAWLQHRAALAPLPALTPTETAPAPIAPAASDTTVPPPLPPAAHRLRTGRMRRTRRDVRGGDRHGNRRHRRPLAADTDADEPLTPAEMLTGTVIAIPPLPPPPTLCAIASNARPRCRCSPAHAQQRAVGTERTSAHPPPAPPYCRGTDTRCMHSRCDRRGDGDRISTVATATADALQEQPGRIVTPVRTTLFPAKLSGDTDDAAVATRAALATPAIDAATPKPADGHRSAAIAAATADRCAKIAVDRSPVVVTDEAVLASRLQRERRRRPCRRRRRAPDGHAGKQPTDLRAPPTARRCRSSPCRRSRYCRRS
jgi:hypothetical protein